MKGSELRDMIQSGVQPVVTFGPRIEDLETSIDANMRGRLLTVTREGDGVFRVTVDLNPFEAYNDRYAKSNYWDGQGNATLTAKQAGYYPKDGIETIYLDADIDMAEHLTLDNDKPFMAPVYGLHIDTWGEREVLNVLFDFPGPDGTGHATAVIAGFATGEAKVYAEKHFPGVVITESALRLPARPGGTTRPHS